MAASLPGLLIGYASHSKPQQQSVETLAVPTEAPAVPTEAPAVPAEALAVPAEAPEPSLDWSNITRMLSERLNASMLTAALRYWFCIIY